jgi:hypothetical protein
MIDFILGILVGGGAILLWQHFKMSPKTAPTAAVIEANLDALGQIVAASEQRILGRLEKLASPEA